MDKQKKTGLAGWTCPVCGSGISPYTQKCPCVSPPIKTQVYYPPVTYYPVTGCTCYRIWSSVTPPPSCPVHGGLTWYPLTGGGWYTITNTTGMSTTNYSSTTDKAISVG